MTPRCCIPNPEEIDPAMMEAQNLLGILSAGVDLENRMVFVCGEINEMTAYRFIVVLRKLDQTPGPIHIVLNSPGGSADDGFAMYDAIRTLTNPVLIEGTGMIASAASIILQAANVRILTPETRVMIHNASQFVGPTHSAALAAIGKEITHLDRRMHEIIAQRTGKAIADVEAACRAETYLSANEAVQFGLADKVIEARPLPANFEAGFAEIQAALVAGGLRLIQNPFEEEKKAPKKGKKPKKTTAKAKPKKGKK